MRLAILVLQILPIEGVLDEVLIRVSLNDTCQDNVISVVREQIST